MKEMREAQWESKVQRRAQIALVCQGGPLGPEKVGREQSLCSPGFSNKQRLGSVGRDEKQPPRNRGSQEGKQKDQCKDTVESAKALVSKGDGANEASQ